MNTGGTSAIVYILITLAIAIPATAVIEGIVILIVFIIWKKKKEKNNILQQYQPSQKYRPSQQYEMSNNDYQEKPPELNGKTDGAVNT